MSRYSRGGQFEADEELLNRCIALTADEGREQTRAIHAPRRLDGILSCIECDHVVKVHRGAQSPRSPREADKSR